MTKTEEALCNGIIFSVPRMVPTAIQEGELENAKYYVVVYLSAQLDNAVMKFYEAPSYAPLKWGNEDIECIKCELDNISNSDNENIIAGYDFGDNAGDCSVFPSEDWIKSNPNLVYNGLMLYPGLKCLIVNIINAIIRNNNE